MRFIIAAALAAAVAGGTAHAQSAGDTGEPAGAPTHVEFIQQAGGMSYDGTTLRLTSPAHATIVMAAGPQPSTGVIDNEAFVELYGALAPAESQDAPNAMLVLSGADEEPAVLELSDPKLEDGDLVYAVTVLEGTLPESHEGVTLVIDPWVHVGPYRPWRAPVVVDPTIVVAPRVVVAPRCHWSPYYYGRVCRY